MDRWKSISEEEVTELYDTLETVKSRALRYMLYELAATIRKAQKKLLEELSDG